MNCFNHTQEPAVAQCSDCGKGLCSECAERYQPILCTPCFQKRKRSEIWRSIFSLLFLIALFVIGFRWNFLATKGFEDMRWMSGYVLMAIWSGYLFAEKFIPYKMIAGTNWQEQTGNGYFTISSNSSSLSSSVFSPLLLLVCGLLYGLLKPSVDINYIE